MAVTAASAGGAALAACSRDGQSGNDKLDRVTYLTSFSNLGRDAYIHAAVHKKCFAEAGIEVNVQYGQAGDYNHKQLLAGRAQFASIDAAGAIIRAGKAATPEDRSLRIVGVVHQRTLNAVAVFADRGFTAPRDLQGTTLGAVVGAAPRALFPAFARLAGIDETTITWVDATTQNSGSLLASNRVAGLATQLPTKPGLEKLAGGRKVVMFPYGDVIADLYGITIMTHQNVIDRSPDLVRRFNRAIMRGVKYAVENPDEIGKVLQGLDNTVDADQAAQELAILKPNSLPTGDVPVGSFDRARMARSLTLLQDLGLIPAGLSPADVADDRFLPQSDR